MTSITAAEQAEFDTQGEVADDQLTTVLDSIPDDVDSVGVLFSLWVNITQLLALSGWTGEELAREAHHHAALATSEGGMQ